MTRTTQNKSNSAKIKIILSTKGKQCLEKYRKKYLNCMRCLKYEFVSFTFKINTSTDEYGNGSGYKNSQNASWRRSTSKASLKKRWEMYLLLGGCICCVTRIYVIWWRVSCQTPTIWVKKMIGKALFRPQLWHKLLDNSVSDSDVTEFFEVVNINHELHSHCVKRNRVSKKMR